MWSLMKGVDAPAMPWSKLVDSRGQPDVARIVLAVEVGLVDRMQQLRCRAVWNGRRTEKDGNPYPFGEIMTFYKP